MTYDQWKDPTDCIPDPKIFCAHCEEAEVGAEGDACADCQEKSYDRQQERLMEDGGPPSLLEQQRAAYKIKHGLR